jgi:hypothetical protein
MTVRKLVAIITKMNKSLTRFPGAKDSDKFDADELLEIIESALPVRWRAKIDLDRYVPSRYDKARLIVEAEGIERSEAVLVKPAKHLKRHLCGYWLLLYFYLRSLCFLVQNQTI